MEFMVYNPETTECAIFSSKEEAEDFVIQEENTNLSIIGCKEATIMNAEVSLFSNVEISNFPFIVDFPSEVFNPSEIDVESGDSPLLYVREN